MSDPLRASDLFYGQWLLGRDIAVQSDARAIAAASFASGPTTGYALIVSDLAGGGTGGGTHVLADQGASGTQAWPVQLTAPVTASVGTIAAVSVSAIPSIVASVSAIPSVLASISAIPSILASVSAIPAVSIGSGTMSVNVATIGSLPTASVNVATIGSLPTQSVNVATIGSLPTQSVNVATIGSLPTASVNVNTIGSLPSISIAANQSVSVAITGQPIGVSNTATGNMVVSQGPPGGTATSDGWIIRQPNSTASILYVNPGPSDINNALSPWNVKAAQGAAGGSASAWFVQGAAATTSAITLNPVPVGLLAMSTLPATNTSGRPVYQLADVRGRAINRAYLPVPRTMATVGITGSGTNSVTGIAAPGAGNAIAIFRMDVYNADSTTQEFRLLNGATNSILYRGFLGSNGNALIDFQAEPLELAANTAAGFNLLSAVGTRSVMVDLWYATYAT